MTAHATLCHGPGCRRDAVVEFFCGESCQHRWDAQWGKRLPEEPSWGALIPAAVRGLSTASLRAGAAGWIPAGHAGSDTMTTDPRLLRKTMDEVRP